MYRKLYLLITFVLLLAMAGTASAVIVWTGASDNDWGNPANWDLGRVPAGGDGDIFVVEKGTKYAEFSSDDSIAGTPSIVAVGQDGTGGESGRLDITGGTIICGCGIVMNRNTAVVPDINSVVNQSGGTVEGGLESGDCGAFQGYVHVGRGGYAVYNMTGGYALFPRLEIPGAKFVADVNMATFNLAGGTVELFANRPDAGGDPNSLFIAVNVNRKRGEDLLLNPDLGYEGDVTNGVLNVTGGTLILKGDQRYLVDRYINSGVSRAVDGNTCIVPYPGSTKNAYIIMDYDGRNAFKTTLTADEVENNQTYNPDPIYEELRISKTPTLRWVAAVSGSDDYIVYLSTDEAAVTNGTAPNSPSGPNTYTPGAFGLDKVVYWRADSNESDVVTAGEVWQFRIEGAAYNPTPADEADIELDYTDYVSGFTLEWVAGADANHHDVFFSTDESAVINGTAPNTVRDVNYTPSLTLGKTYYWRVDEVNDTLGTRVTGDTWEFSIKPYILHDDFEAYVNASGSPWYIKRTWTQFSVSRVKVQPASDAQGTYAPPHDNSAQTLELKYVLNADTEETRNWFGGGTGVSGPSKTPQGPQDWSPDNISNCKALAIHFYGQPSNTIEDQYGDGIVPMYVVLRDSAGDESAVIYYDDPNDLAVAKWHTWNIELSQFNNGATFDINDVNGIGIGFGDDSSTSYDLGSYVYFDNIRLYPSRCVPSETGLIGDCSEDCTVDYKDVKIMSDDWLEGDSNGAPNGILMSADTNKPQWVTGKWGNAVELDGVDDWIDIEDWALTDFADKTLSMWLKIREAPEDTTPEVQIAYIFGTEAQNYRVFIRLTDANDIHALVREPGLATDPNFGQTLVNDSAWHHIALAVDDIGGAEVISHLYIDGGAEKGNSGNKDKHYGVLEGANIGSINDGGGGNGRFIIDDFRVYDTYLSEAEVNDLADGNSLASRDANLLIYYDFNETSGDQAATSGTITQVYVPVLDDEGEVPAADIYTGEAPASGPTGNRFVNNKDFAELADEWLVTGSDWP